MIFRSLQPVQKVCAIFGIGMGLFTAMRGLMVVSFSEDFHVLNLAQLLEAFAVGLRFDASILAVVMFLPLSMLLLVPATKQPWGVWWQRCWQWVSYGLLLMLCLMMVADALFFDDTHRHVGSEIKAIGQDWFSLASLAWSQYLGVTLTFVAFAAFCAYCWHVWLSPKLEQRLSVLGRLVAVVLFGAVSLVLARGGFGLRPIGVADAFFSQELAQGYLVLNGPFVITRALMKHDQAPVSLLPAHEAQQHVADLLGTASAGQDLLQHPLSARRVTQRPNVVILLLESWGADQIDALRQTRHLPPLGATPHFDALAKHGRLFTNFYASGQRSITGISSVLTGLPVLPQMPALGDGMEQYPVTFIADLAKQNGYQTWFMQSSDRTSLRLHAISGRAGFQNYLGSEDMPEQHEAKKAAGAWGTWDHNTLQEANQRFKQSGQPFLGFIFTSTTHSPWLIPGDQWKKFKGSGDKDRALNALFYADWALGEFVAAAKAAGYYDNTVFMLLADHASPFIEDRSDARNLFRIPLLMVGPGITPGVDTRVASQVDLAPTVFDLTGASGTYLGFGKSLQRPSLTGEDFALGVSDRVVTFITKNGWVSHDLKQRVGAGGLSASELAKAEENLLSLYQVTTQAQTQNQPRAGKR